MKKVLYLDFDKTLFDLARFRRHVDETLVSADIDTTAYNNTIDDYHEAQDGAVSYRLYQAEQHVEDKLNISWDEYRLLVKGASDSCYCYSDTHDYLDQVIALGDVEVRILTYGHENGQRLKLQTCQRIIDLPADIVCEPKADFLARHTGHVGVLIDDKVQLQLPSHVQHIWINRYDKKIYHGAHIEVTNLDINDLYDTHLLQ